MQIQLTSGVSQEIYKLLWNDSKYLSNLWWNIHQQGVIVQKSPRAGDSSMTNVFWMTLKKTCQLSKFFETHATQHHDMNSMIEKLK